MFSMTDLYGMPPKTAGEHQFKTFCEYIGYLKEIGREAAHGIYWRVVESMTDAELEAALNADKRSWADFQTDEEYAYRCHVFLLAERAERELFKRKNEDVLNCKVF